MDSAPSHGPPATASVDPTESRTAVPATGSEPTGRARTRFIFILGALVALVPLTIDLYLPALPAIRDDLNSSSSAVQLTLTGTLLGLGLGQLAIGPLSDTLGRRIPLIAGIGVHIAASVLCLLAPNIAILGVLRALQGAGAAAAMVVALAVVRDLFSGNSAATALSRLMLVMGAAPVLAPTLGGLLLLAGSWRGVFAALAVLGVALLLVAIFALKETLPPQDRRTGEVKPVLRTYRSLLSDPEFMVLALVSALGMSALFAYISGAPFVFQQQYGLNQQQFGLIFGVGAVAIIGASQFNVVLLNRFTPQQIVLRSLSAATLLGLVFSIIAVTGFGGMIAFMVPMWLMLGAVGFVLPNAPALALSRHGEAAGTAAALLGATQFGLGALIAPLVGVLGNNGPAMAITMTGGSTVGLIMLSLTMLRQRKGEPATVG